MGLRWGVALYFGLQLAGCATVPPEDLPEVSRAETDADGVQRAEIVGGTHWYRPERLVVEVGRPVALSLRNASAVVPHSFVIDAPEAGMDVEVELTREPATVRFTPKRVGEYTFYCDEVSPSGATHRDKGMVGTLEVVEAFDR